MSMPPPDSPAGQLRGNIGYAGYFALGFGCIIGSGWVLILRDWVAAAGSGGAILGFVLGGIVMVAIGACYAELTSRLPEAGGEFVYIRAAFGADAAFASGWFMLLYLISVMVFEGIALAEILERLLPSLNPVTLYSLLGQPVTQFALFIGIGGAIAIGAINSLGIGVASPFHNVLTYSFLTISLCLLAALGATGQPAHLLPILDGASGAPWWQGTLWIFATSAFLLNGFQAIPQAIEERSGALDLTAATRLVMVSIAGATAFYCLAILTCTLALPRAVLLATPLPAVAALRQLPWGGFLERIFLVALVMSIVKSWNGMLLMAVRLVVGMARARSLPRTLAILSGRNKTPQMAIAILSLLTVAGIFLGKGAIIPIVNMCALGLTMVMMFCCLAVPRLRRIAGPSSGFAVGRMAMTIAVPGSIVMALVAIAAPMFALRGGVPIEYVLLATWAAVGAIVWRMIYRSSLS